MAEKLTTVERTGTTDKGAQDTGMFPFDAFEFNPATALLTLRSPWILGGSGLNLTTAITGTATALASANPVLLVGQLGYETDTLSFKIGDGATAYNALAYFYRGLPVAGEPSHGTPHPTSDANRTSTLVVNTSTNTAGVWSAEVTMTGVPVGAKAAWCLCSIYKSGAVPLLAVEAATGYTLSDISSGNNIRKYWAIGKQGATGDRTFGVIKIHLDANGQFKWCTSISSSEVIIGSAIDYEL